MVKESELDDDQLKILNAVLDKSLIVTGCAGSGKSVLALIKAARIQRERGNNYQIIVFTKALCGYMNSGRKELGLRKEFNYYWDWKYRLKCPSATYTIVDEIQDFTREEIQEFIRSTSRHFFFFGDTAQSIYEGLKETLSVEEIPYMFSPNERPKTFDLYRNYRLPKAVAKFAQYIGTDLQPYVEDTYKSRMITTPFVLSFNNADEQATFIGKTIKDKNLTDVSVLLPDNDMVRNFAEKLGNVGINCEIKYNDKVDWHNNVETLNFSTTNVKVMTYHSAKGLQFETVFLPLLDQFEQVGDRKKPLYVAATRTYKDLYLMYSGSMPSVIRGIPASLYKTDSNETVDDI